MSPKEARREFDEIVGRLTEQDPDFGRPVHILPRGAVLALVAVGGGLAWAGLSILMVIWGAAGVMITCVAVAAVVTGIAIGRRGQRRVRSVPGPPDRADD